MIRDTVLLGSAQAISDAWTVRADWAPASLSVRGVVLIGPGDAPAPVLGRAPVWDALDLSAVQGASVILIDPPADGAAKRAVLTRAAAAGLRCFLLAEGKLRRLRLDDLIGRPLGDVDFARIREVVAGRRVLITGGGGSIGGELARRIATLSPARLTLLDSSEHNLYRIGLELRDAVQVLADIRDERSVGRWFATERPEIVFHAAALKQVPMVEAFPSEGVLTNVLGLQNVAEAAQHIGADLIFVSTDKAVDPSGLVGASKRLGEIYCQALDRQGPDRAIPVRLGNVLGSAGSVTPIFEGQLAAGGPLTVTDPDVTRFFLTIPQAADALLQAAAVGLNAEPRGCALVIEMGEALPVVELAREVIRLEGLRPDVDVPIIYTGLRPGEKLHEALVASDEWQEADPAPGVIAVASPARAFSDVSAVMAELTALARDGANEKIAAALFDAIGGDASTSRAQAG
ncbi:MAG: polysaccharide biosynthesis protein [Alphaproteobacteria bacterium]|nr:polysaccharide biosynthesis protein [Alphaproteobacteria bacterium]